MFVIPLLMWLILNVDKSNLDKNDRLWMLHAMCTTAQARTLKIPRYLVYV